MRNVAENLWIQTYPLNVLGTEHGRTCTVIRLKSGKLLVHSMAPFSQGDIAVIHELGEPAWLAEAMLLHDTYAAKGQEAFPELPFYGPPGFGDIVKFQVHSLATPPPEWEEEIMVLPVHGAPKLKEYAFLHIPSRTLIVADLVFNFRQDEKGWDRFFHRWIAGLKRYPAMSRVFRWCIDDRQAFLQSLDRILAQDFDRLIPGHGQLIPENGKKALRLAIEQAEMGRS